MIPVHNRLKKTINCIKSVIKQKNCEKLKIIIVNDGSTDGTSKYIKKNFPKVVVLEGSGSLYWGGAINLGVKYIKKNSNKNDWLLIINNDVELAPESVSELIKLSKLYKRKVLVGGLSINSDDKKTVIKSGTIVKSWFLNKTKHVYEGLNIFNLRDKSPINVDFLTGRCLLHPVEVFSKTNNYDSKTFKHYGGDDEFSMRVKKYDYLTLLCPNSINYLKSNVLKKSNRNFFKNFFYIFFNIRSSSNIYNKFNLTLKVVPFYAKPSFFLIGILKSMYIFFRNEIKY